MKGKIKEAEEELLKKAVTTNGDNEEAMEKGKGERKERERR